jgi:predicted aldo/keto reductase-like oxidoreductase
MTVTEGSEKHLSRRDFLRRAAVLAGTAAGVGAFAPHVSAAKPKAEQMKYRLLGRTGLKVSELAMGDGLVPLIHRAIDLGVNYFDTAPSYGEGSHERMLGRALQGRRSEAIIATKWYGGSADKLVKQVEGSLKRLQTDHVDIIQIHGADDVESIESEARWEAFNRLKEAGKVRFNGFTFHPEAVKLVEVAIRSGRYDTMLCFYSALQSLEIGEAIHAAARAGVGVVATKTLQPAVEGKASEALMNLRGNLHQKALQWALLDQSVTAALVGITDFDQFEVAYTAVTSPMTLAEREEFERAVAQLAVGTCHLCGRCLGECPAGVRIADVMRCLLYHDGYRDVAKARDTYRSLPVNASACADCAECPVTCPWQVTIRPRLERAHAVLA